MSFSLKRIEITALVVLLLLFGTANFTSAQSSTGSTSTAATIRAEIASLLEQVSKLQEQLRLLQQSAGTSTSQGTPPLRVCPLIARVLLSGMSGDDVANLQAFLAEEGYFNGNITAYFGPLTEAALRKWQAAQGIISSGDSATTGWGAVGPRTKEFILRRCGLPGQGGWMENRPIPPLGTTTVPGSRWLPDQAGEHTCPVVGLPTADSCAGTWKLEWKSVSDVGMKCLAWKCHSGADNTVSTDRVGENTCPAVAAPTANSCSGGTWTLKYYAVAGGLAGTSCPKWECVPASPSAEKCAQFPAGTIAGCPTPQPTNTVPDSGCPLGTTYVNGVCYKTGEQLPGGTAQPTSASCIAPWSNSLVANGHRVYYQPYFTAGSYTGSAENPVMVCSNGSWLKCGAADSNAACTPWAPPQSSVTGPENTTQLASALSGLESALQLLISKLN